MNIVLQPWQLVLVILCSAILISASLEGLDASLHSHAACCRADFQDANERDFSVVSQFAP